MPTPFRPSRTAAAASPGSAPADSAAVRVAVASRDGDVVDAHFGQATRFEIWELTGGTPRQIEVRQSKPGCGCGTLDQGSVTDRMQAATALVADCRAVLVARIGDHGVAQLAALGILAFETGDTVEVALRLLSESPALVAPAPLPSSSREPV
jgi:nitrogen fixation protein NifB